MCKDCERRKALNRLQNHDNEAAVLAWLSFMVFLEMVPVPCKPGQSTIYGICEVLSSTPANHAERRAHKRETVNDIWSRKMREVFGS